MNFVTKWNYKTEKLVLKDGTVHTASGEKLYCENCRFPFRKEHIAETDKDGNITLFHDASGHVFCPICASKRSAITPIRPTPSA